ncbi:2-phosphoglycerate kinase [Methanobrevibacter sp. OttesenSCG-928-K11]|nr:2-phosphoglycerate kinase [Methanobrevibacter sp. OttesenSCG-928-K11]MDL2271151.1 2-phosphoglycerate kinase [Methanobrevibacter sp. OttesenSCG-928-I08]
MIMVQGDVGGRKYTEPFSKGILARSLTTAELGSNKAYNLASYIESQLIEDNISLINIEDLVDIIIKELNKEDPAVAKKYINWRLIRKSKEPLIILIGGASGVGTSSIAFELANRLGIKTMISTDMIREVMRKIVSKELSPVIHESSFNAYKGMRVLPPGDLDKVLAGFINHVDTVSVGIDGVIERALKEGISIVIEGVHLVPGIIKQELVDRENVILFTLNVPDEEMHKGRFYSRCREMWASRPLQLYLDNFISIRRTQKYIIDQAEKYDSKLIENIDVIKTIDIMISFIIENYGGMNNVE